MKPNRHILAATRAIGMGCSSSPSLSLYLSRLACPTSSATTTTATSTSTSSTPSRHYQRHSCYSLFPKEPGTKITAISSPKKLASLRNNALRTSRAPTRQITLSPVSRRHQSTMAQPRPEPAWSEGTDMATAQPQLEALLVAAQGGGSNGKWTLRSDGAALERAVAFKTFKAAWAFMDAVAGQCKKARHHPEWSNVYSRVWIRWTTHSPAGLSQKDLDMAATCDELANAEGEIAADESDTAALQHAANTVAAAAGDCCVPRSSKSQQKTKQEVEREESEAQGSVAGIGGQPS